MRERLHILSIGILSGLLAGILPGIGARIAMRVVAIAIGRGTSLDIGVTLLVIVVPAAVVGGILGVFYLGLRDYIPSKNRLIHGMVYGTLIFLLFAAPFFLVQDEFMRDIRLSPILGRFLFFVLPYLFSFPLVYIVPIVEAKLGKPAGEMTRLEIARNLVSLGLTAFSILVFVAFYSAILAESARLIGQPVRTWIVGGRLNITPLMIVGALLVLSYPAFMLLSLYLPLRRYLFGANWLRGLLIGCTVACVGGIVAYIQVDAIASTSILMRAPLTGLVLLSVLLVIYGAGMPAIQQTMPVDGLSQTVTLSLPTKAIIAVVVISESLLLLASALA